MNKSIKFFLNYLAGPLIFLVLCWALYKQIAGQDDLMQKRDLIFQSWKHPLLWVAVILMFVNWGLESGKWKLLLSHLEEVSFIKAFKSVLSGVSITLFTPNRTGEFAGRVLFVNPGHRLTAISLTILGNMAQLLITLMAGIVSYFVIRQMPEWSVKDPYGMRSLALEGLVLPLSMAFTVLLALFYFRLRPVVSCVAGMRILQKIVKHLLVLESFSRKQLLRILLLSLIRYLVFILQYILILDVFGAGMAWSDAFWLISVFYFLMACIPTIGFSELPLKAAVSVELFSIFSSNALGIQAAAFAIWIINLALPALAGGVLILGHKMYKE